MTRDDLSRNPMGGVLSRQISRKGYSYAENNAANWNDPSGEYLNILAGTFIWEFEDYVEYNGQ